MEMGLQATKLKILFWIKRLNSNQLFCIVCIKKAIWKYFFKFGLSILKLSYISLIYIQNFGAKQS